MKSLTPYLLAIGVAAVTSAGNAATILSQNFDTSPINYTLPPLGGAVIVSNDFRFQISDPARYWGLSNMTDTASGTSVAVNPGITGNTTVYLAAQNMNNDGDGTLTFDPLAGTNPGQMDFTVNVAGFTDLRFSFDVAGLTSPEPENFVRVFTDDDNDGFYETPVIDFSGTGNLPYTETTTGAQLTPAFQTFGDLPLNFPTAADRNLRVRLEVFNDTNTMTEAVGIDNIVISGIPEPTSSMLVLTGMLALTHRRRRSKL